MAQTVTVLITDVIDGSPDAQTLRFACHRQHHREAFTLTGLTAQLTQLRTGIEAPAAKARRREEQLRDVADRAAKRVLQTGKIIQLEPMPAIERRIVHMALVENGKVRTQSVGVEPNRRIVILPATKVE